MDKQVIVSISREFCSGGHAIGEYIAKAMGLGLVDRNMLDEIAQRKNIRIEYPGKIRRKAPEPHPVQAGGGVLQFD